jgi:hypothetical protein
MNITNQSFSPHFLILKANKIMKENKEAWEWETLSAILLKSKADFIRSCIRFRQRWEMLLSEDFWIKLKSEMSEYDSDAF